MQFDYPLPRILFALGCGVCAALPVRGIDTAPPDAGLTVTDSRDAIRQKSHQAQFAAPSAYSPATKSSRKSGQHEHYVPFLRANNLNHVNYGIYGFEPVAGSSEPQWEIICKGASDGSAELKANFGGVFKDGIYHCLGGYDYGSSMFIMRYTEWDATTWTCSRNERIQNRAFMATDLTVDPATGRIYGYFSDEAGEGQEFGYIDYEGLLRHTVCAENEEKMVAVAADADGRIFAISLAGDLYSVSKADGVRTLVGNTGVELEDLNMTAAFDTTTGTLYWIAACADGSLLYTVDTTTGAATLVQPLGQDLYSALDIPASTVAFDAPAGISGFAADFNNPTDTGTISFLLPTTTFMGEPLSGQLTYTVKSDDGTLIADGSGRTGEAVSRQVTLSPGLNTLNITVTGNSGDGPVISHEVWAGPDEPCAVENLKAEASEGGIVITWDAPAKGVHEGYIDASQLTYRIVRMPDETLLAEAQADTSFTDRIDHPGLKGYSYVVTPQNGTLHGPGAESNICVAGRALDVPFTEEFLSQDAFNAFTVIDADADGNTWQWVDNDGRPYGGERETFAGIYINAADMSHTSDDYIITPAVVLRAGERYEIAFNVAGFTGADDYFDVLFGRGDDPADFETIMPDVHLDNSEYSRFTHSVDVTESGDYKIAFHFKSCGDRNGFMMKLGDISMDLEQNESQSPDAVGSLTATADAEGLPKVSISFTAPATTIDGQRLESIERIVIVRTTDNSRVKTFDSPRPGEALVFTDTDVPTGMNTYTVTCYAAGNKGKEATVSVFVGEDIPFAPTDVHLTDNLDSTATLSWKSPGSVGTEGHLVNESKLTYNVYYSGGELYESGFTDTTLTFTGLPQDGPQQIARLLVSAVSSKGEGDQCASTAILTGEPYRLPYYESFPGKAPTHDFYWQQGNGEYQFQLTDAMSSDGDDGSIFWTSADESLYQSFIFGKMNVSDCRRPVMTFTYLAAPDFDIVLEAGYLTPAGEEVALSTVDYKDLLGKNGWRKAAVDLSSLKNAKYFIPYVKASGAGATSHSVVLDDFRFIDSDDNNLSVILPKTSFEGRAGDNISVACILRNNGSLPVNDCTVTLSDGTNTVASLSGIAVPPFSDTKVSLDFIAPSAADGTVTLSLAATHKDDPEAANNRAEISLKVTDELLPAPASLTAKESENGVLLEWEAPAGDGVYVEDFERYPAWASTEIGKWSTYDADGGRNYGFATLENIPGQYGYTAFTVFSPEAAGIDLTTNPTFAPVSASKYLFNWSSELSTMAEGYSDDWLISPELSGDAQTVSFWLSNFWSYIGSEAELWYSTAGKKKSDFVRIGRIVADKAGFVRHEFDIPAGARYFAIELLAGDKGAMGIDDISFRPLFRKVAGYAIYRDGVRLASASADDRSYTDTAADGRHTYSVAAIYSLGESKGNPEADANTGAIKGTEIHAFEVIAGQGKLTVTNPGGKTISIYTLQGLPVAGSDRQAFTVSVPAGVYLVKGYGTVTKKAVN